MNLKMRNKIKLIFILLIAINIVSCSDRQAKRISSVIPLAESNPTTALDLLSKIDQTKLSDKDLALYSLVYTMAQDKSGFDVDNDSLLRNAYNWYLDKPTDSLYAKFEYYMGKYYSLNDSSEKALNCFKNSIKVSRDQQDYYTQSLALVQASVVLRNYDQDLAIKYAISADSIYNKVKGATLNNKAYNILNIAECYLYKNPNTNKSIDLAIKAIGYAKTVKDSNTIADAYQDLSVFYGMQGNDSSLYAAKTAFSYRSKKDVSTYYALSMAYFQADSLKQAKLIISKIPEKSLIRHGYEIFSLLKNIALKEHDYKKISELADSTVYYLEKEDADNSQAKDRYYSMMIKKEVQSTQYRSESKWKTKLIIITIILSIVIIMFIIYVYVQRKEKYEEKVENEREKQELEIRNKIIQINTMRDFLVRKIDIINKLESFKSNSKAKIILSEEDWEEIELFLNNTDGNFAIRLHNTFPNLTTKDLRFMMLLRLKLPNSSLAVIYNIEEKSIRQNLFLIKKKLGIEGKSTSARKFIEDF